MTLTLSSGQCLRCLLCLVFNQICMSEHHGEFSIPLQKEFRTATSIHVSATHAIDVLSYACTSSHLELGPPRTKIAKMPAVPQDGDPLDWVLEKWRPKSPKTSHLLKEERKAKEGKSMRIQFLVRLLQSQLDAFPRNIRPFCSSGSMCVVLLGALIKVLVSHYSLCVGE